jgi:hypothetical protein
LVAEQHRPNEEAGAVSKLPFEKIHLQLYHREKNPRGPNANSNRRIGLQCLMSAPKIVNDHVKRDSGSTVLKLQKLSSAE